MMSRHIPTHIQHAVLKRQNCKCKHCNMHLDVYDMDHIVPYRICREHKLKNLQALCPTCHARKTRNEARHLNTYIKCEKTPSYRFCWGCKLIVSLFFGYKDGYCTNCSLSSSMASLSLR